MPHLVRGAGEHYLPLPNARLVEPHAVGDPNDVVVFAPAGTPVHAVCAGTVRDGDAAALRIEGDDGHTCVYSAVDDRRVAPGERVDAGAIVGVIGTVGDRHVLRLAVTDRRNVPVRPHELLLGAVDPNDLGYGPAGTGMDLDPDASGATRVRSAPAPAGRPPLQGTRKRQPPPATSPSTTSPPTSPSTTSRVTTPRPSTPRAAAPRPAAPVRPAPTTPPGAADLEPRREPAPEVPDDRGLAADDRSEEPRREPASPDKVIPPPPPPVPLIGTQEDERDEQSSAPSATRSEEQKRTRAAMLIASRRRRPDDTGPQR